MAGGIMQPRLPALVMRPIANFFGYPLATSAGYITLPTATSVTGDEPEIAAKLVPALSPADLGEVARDPTVHPLVRGLAERLAAGRSGAGLARRPGAAVPGAGPAAPLDEPAERVAQIVAEVAEAC